jgi:acetyl esterase/lipase
MSGLRLRDFLARWRQSVVLTAVLALCCAVASFGQTQAEEHTRSREQIQADILAGRRLPAITPIPAPSEVSAIALYPNATVEGPDEQWEELASRRIVRNVVRPTLTPYLPDAARANGAAVIIAPGGAFRYLVMEDEGATIARRLAERGVAAFVLKYRTDTTSRNSRQFVEQLFKLLANAVTATNAEQGIGPIATPETALDDAKSAVTLVRRRAAEWHVDPARVGFIGFSAGAFLSLSVGLVAESSERPDFIALFYGPTTIKEVPLYAPAMFLGAALDDPLFSHGTGNLVRAWSSAKRPIEAHLYEHGGHGFAKGTTSELWFEHFLTWMDRVKLCSRRIDAPQNEP